MIRNQKQAGFTIVEVLLVLILLAIVGFTGYYVWHSQKKTDETLTTTNNTAQTATPKQSTVTDNQKYLAITEWGVKIPLAADISDAYYIQQHDINAVYLSLTNYKGTDCAADNVSLGLIQRFTAADKDDDGNALVSDYPAAIKIGNNYYQYQHPQAACDGGGGVDNSSSSPYGNTGADKASALMSEFKAASEHIVAAN
jgi:prepilin-type N-terminal cleavage/methylation domain-containing protein